MSTVCNISILTSNYYKYYSVIIFFYPSLWDHKLPKSFCITMQCDPSSYCRAKEKADVENMPSVRGFFKDQSQYDERMSKEQVCKLNIMGNRMRTRSRNSFLIWYSAINVYFVSILQVFVLISLFYFYSLTFSFFILRYIVYYFTLLLYFCNTARGKLNVLIVCFVYVPYLQ